jgi:fructan beta-fructosidase
VGGVWECPDLFELPVEGEPGQTRWVLNVNLNPGGFAGGSGDQYFIGQFDGTTFTNENPKELTLWSDYGKDFYASTSFADIPKSDGRRIWLAWMVNWEYARKVPSSPWRGAMTIPRELKLRKLADGIRLVQEPVAELKSLREGERSVEEKNISGVNQWLRANHVHGDTLEIEAEIDLKGASEAGIKVRQGEKEETVVGVSAKSGKLFVERTHSGDVSFAPEFPGRQEGPMPLRKGTAKLHIFVDRASVEVFGNDGETEITDTIFPRPGSQGIEFYSQGGEARVRSLRIWKLKSEWNPR